MGSVVLQCHSVLSRPLAQAQWPTVTLHRWDIQHGQHQGHRQK